MIKFQLDYVKERESIKVVIIRQDDKAGLYVDSLVKVNIKRLSKNHRRELLVGLEEALTGIMASMESRVNE